jgi:hypothetical protein
MTISEADNPPRSGEDFYGPSSLEEDGAHRVKQAVAEPALAILDRQLPSSGVAGERLTGLPWLDDWVSANLLPPLHAVGIARGFRPGRAILFDKTATGNWALGWHQDRVIAVKRRIAAEDYGPWSLKRGIQHVEPPFAVMAEMITVRLHLDPVDVANAPLRVALGSHRLGRIVDAKVDDVVVGSPTFTCLAERGDAWIYATPILHASSAAAEPRRRRVLQIDLARGGLPGGVEWLGIA